jgi:hypothetical protein
MAAPAICSDQSAAAADWRGAIHQTKICPMILSRRRLHYANIDGARHAPKTVARPIKTDALANLQILDAIAHQVSAPDKKLGTAISAQPAVPSSGMPLDDRADISSHAA